MVLMIDNPHQGTFNLGVELFPYLMGTFYFPPPSNDAKFILVVPDQPKAAIFQVASFQMTYFNDPCTLPSPLALMEWVGNPDMAMSLSIIEITYNIVQQTSSNFYPTPPQEPYPILEPIWAQESLTYHDPLDLVFPSDEAILEEMKGLNRPWDDIHHRSYFLLERRRVEVGEFTTTMNGYVSRPVNPLEKYIVYVEEDMVSIDKMISIDISKTLDFIENVFIEEDCPPKEI